MASDLAYPIYGSDSKFFFWSKFMYKSEFI